MHYVVIIILILILLCMIESAIQAALEYWYTWVPIVVGIVAAWIAFVVVRARRREEARRKAIMDRERQASEELSSKREQMSRNMKALAITCPKCQEGLAEPIPDTANRYKCSRCGFRGAGPDHGIQGDLLEEYEADVDSVGMRERHVACPYCDARVPPDTICRQCGAPLTDSEQKS